MGIATEELERRIRTCTLCRLHRNRKNAVPGEGPYDARVMLLGEAPGRNEDLRGIPFCGAAGKFLDELLEIAGLKREEVYITNTVKCRPPQNRAPRDDEIKICASKYLKKQVKIVRPELIVVLGRTAAKALLGKEIPITANHGKVMTVKFAGLNFLIFLTYHPAAALYGARTRSKLREDFAKLAEVLKTARIPRPK
ncbi:MAG: uracil-DNA glycosylase [Candidatus Hadarchaeum sp.]|uniref:uracil-DNA glycosylase n=1 Tax=Candidatus Hadarchaeum sp. TaxID=2883567 RepID=UPI003177E963